MARVSTRVGWGRGSGTGFAMAALNGLLALVLFLNDEPRLGFVLLGFVALATFFALVHPHRIIALDDDDDPSRKVGDLVDD